MAVIVAKCLRCGSCLKHWNSEAALRKHAWICESPRQVFIFSFWPLGHLSSFFYVNMLAFFILILSILEQKHCSFMSIKDNENTLVGIDSNKSKHYVAIMVYQTLF